MRASRRHHFFILLVSLACLMQHGNTHLRMRMTLFAWFSFWNQQRRHFYRSLNLASWFSPRFSHRLIIFQHYTNTKFIYLLFVIIYASILLKIANILRHYLQDINHHFNIPPSSSLLWSNITTWTLLSSWNVYNLLFI